MFSFLIADQRNVFGRKGRLGQAGTGSRVRRVCGPAHVERRVRRGTQDGRRHHQQQHQPSSAGNWNKQNCQLIIFFFFNISPNFVKY